MTPREANIAFKKFIDAHSKLPGETSAPISVLSYPSAAAKPVGGDFIAFTPVTKVPRSWGTDFFESDMSARELGTWAMSRLYEITYQVDVYGPQCSWRGEQLVALFNSGIGAAFMRQFAEVSNPAGIGIVRAGTVSDMTEKVDTPEYEPRHISEFRVLLHITAGVPAEWFDKISFTLDIVEREDLEDIFDSVWKLEDGYLVQKPVEAGIENPLFEKLPDGFVAPKEAVKDPSPSDSLFEFNKDKRLSPKKRRPRKNG